MISFSNLADPAIAPPLVAVSLHSQVRQRTIRMRAAKQFRLAESPALDDAGSAAADASLFGPAKEDRTGRAYNQAMFRHFLTLERKRFERSGRPFLLLLVELRKKAEADAPFEPRVAAKLFDALWQSLRETDFAGWYREGHVAGAVLTQPLEAVGKNTGQAIRERIGEALCNKLAPHVAVRLQVTVHQFPKEQDWPWL
jgi:hypothetical protein